MLRSADAVVVGGGPAGLAAAIALRTRGLRVIVADGGEFPSETACGEGLLPPARRALEYLGVSLEVGEGRPFRGLRFFDGEDVAEAALPAPGGWAIRRSALHRKLAQAAEAAGAALLWQTPVIAIAKHGVLAGDEDIRARWIIGADGGQSRVRAWCGLDRGGRVRSRFAHRRHFAVRPWSDYTEVYWGRRSQAFATATGANEVCVATISEDSAPTFEAILAEFPPLLERLAGRAATDTMRGRVTSMRRLPRVTMGNIALVGDASGGVDAITGEGLGLGFQHALLLASAITAGDLRRYERAHRRGMRRPWLMAEGLLAMARHAGLRRRVFGAFLAEGDLFSRLLEHHSGVASAARSASAGLRLGWRLLRA